MTRNKINEDYLNWMYSIVADKKLQRHSSYRKLLSRLHAIDFSYSMNMDGNRAADGENLRYRFGDDVGIEPAIVSTFLDDKPCSVLEMMVALSIRCEEHIMGDQDIGDRTGLWFWGMIENLGLISMTDTAFNKKKVDDAIDILLNREYEPNGRGGLFTVKNHRDNLREVEIWYQLMWYLNEIM